MDEKPVLAIETSQALCSACVYYNDDKYFQAGMNLKNAHAEKIFELVDIVIKNAGISFSVLEAVAVSSGPGSFTGLRIGMSAAKGIAFGANIGIIPVPTFEALALQISGFLPEGNDFIIANKVNSEELYYAKFKVCGNSFIFTEKLDIIRKEELKMLQGIPVFGNYAGMNIKSSPDSLYVAKMSRSIKPVVDFDDLEPTYIKNFFIKEKLK